MVTIALISRNRWPSGIVAAPDLARWTPVALNRAGMSASIDWGDLNGVRFDEPFFHQTVERWAGGDPKPLVRTGLDALEALADAPALEPAAIVFHASRCGSTLLARLLRAVPGMLVLAEPQPISEFLLLAGTAPMAANARMLRLLALALGRPRFGDERHYILKLSSWNIRYHALLRRAFPGAAFIWLQREPAAIAASLIADPPGWLALRHRPEAARAAFGIDDPPADGARFAVRALAAMLAAANEIADGALVLDYADLPEGAWRTVAPFLGIELAPGDVTKMCRESRYDAKVAGYSPFAGGPPRPALSDDITALVAAAATPHYHALDRRRAGRD